MLTCKAEAGRTRKSERLKLETKNTKITASKFGQAEPFYTNTGTEKIYLYIRIYTVRIYTAYIYLYGLGQPYVYDCIFDEIPAKLPYIHRIYMVLANPTNAAYCVLDACLRCQMLQTVYYTHACVVKCRILCTIV